MLTYSDVIISGNELYITFNTTYILKKKHPKNKRWNKAITLLNTYFYY